MQRIQGQFGLVEQFECVVPDVRAYGRHHLQSADCGLAVSLVITAHRHAFGLAHAHGIGRLPQQPFRHIRCRGFALAITSLNGLCHTERARYLNAVIAAISCKRCLKYRQQMFAELSPSTGKAQSAKPYCKAIAANPRTIAQLADLPLNAFCDGGKQTVPGLMAICIIHFLEVIQIERNQAAGWLVFKAIVYVPEKGGTIQQASQGVVGGPVGQLLFAGKTLSKVTQYNRKDRI